MYILEVKNTFYVLYTISLLLALQMCQFVLPHSVYIAIILRIIGALTISSNRYQWLYLCLNVQAVLCMQYHWLPFISSVLFTKKYPFISPPLKQQEDIYCPISLLLPRFVALTRFKFSSPSSFQRTPLLPSPTISSNSFSLFAPSLPSVARFVRPYIRV